MNYLMFAEMIITVLLTLNRLVTIIFAPSNEQVLIFNCTLYFYPKNDFFQICKSTIKQREVNNGFFELQKYGKNEFGIKYWKNPAINFFFRYGTKYYQSVY